MVHSAFHMSNCNGNNADASSNDSITMKINIYNNNNNKYGNILNNLCMGRYILFNCENVIIVTRYLDRFVSKYSTSDCGKNKHVQGYGKTNAISSCVITNVRNVNQYSMGEFVYFIIDDGG